MKRKLGAWETAEIVVERNACGSSTRSKQHVVFGGAPFPARVVRARGSRVTCSDGRAYCDWIAGLGAVGLGYSDDDVSDAVRAAVELGVAIGSLPHALEEEVAAQLCYDLYWPEQVRWVNSGSEATEGAMRLARRHTGRSLVYSVGYHGHHQAHLPGPDLVSVPYNDDLDFFPPLDYRAAAAIVEGGREHAFDPAYLLQWRQWCDASGALMIMDEVWSGFRVAVGGCAEKYLRLFDATPDLATFSKALGNGYPVAAIVGPARVMKYAGEVSSTFGGNVLGLAAAGAVMRAYRERPVIQRLEEIGARLLAECSGALTGTTARPRFRSPDRSIEYVQALARRGHLVHPAGITPMYAHSDADVESLISAIKEACQ